MTLFPGLLIALSFLWIAFEVGLVIRDRIRGRGKTGKDRGTRNANFLFITAGMFLGGFLGGRNEFLFTGERTWTLYWVGIGIMLLGFAFRVWAVATLGSSFRTTVETHEGQAVVTRGPYGLVRHPSYTGILVITLGYGIALQSWLSLAFAVLLPLAALIYRIHVEETALLASIGPDYEAYQRRTKRLIPWVW